MRLGDLTVRGRQPLPARPATLTRRRQALSTPPG